MWVISIPQSQNLAKTEIFINMLLIEVAAQFSPIHKRFGLQPRRTLMRFIRYF